MARFGVKEVCDVTFYNERNEPVLFLDTLKISNLENDADRTYVTGGRGNPRLMAFDFNRTATFNITDALLNPKAIAMQVGTELITEVAEIHLREVLSAGADGSITLTNAPVSDITIFPTEDGYTQNPDTMEVITPTTDAGGATVTTYTPATASDRYIVYYRYETAEAAQTISIRSDKFSETYKIVGDTIVKNFETKEDEAFQIVIPQAKISSAFELSLEAEGDPSVFDMSLDVFKPDDGQEMVRMIRH